MISFATGRWSAAVSLCLQVVIKRLVEHSTVRVGLCISPLLRTVCVIAGATTLALGTLGAQSAERSVALGVAVPTGSVGSRRTPGPLMRGAVTFGDRQQRHVRLRLELEAAWLVGREQRAGQGEWSAGTLRAVSGLASMVLGATGTPAVAPYLVVGVGLQRLSVDGLKNPYGTTFGFRGGAGLQWRMGTRTMFAEITPHVAATDFGTTADFSAATYIPISVGVRF